MSIDEKAFEAAKIAYDSAFPDAVNITYDGLKSAIKAYESAKSAEQPVGCAEAFEKWINTSEGYGLAFARDCWNAAWEAAGATKQPVGLTDEKQLGCLAEDILKMLADHVHNCQLPLRTKLCTMIRPYIATNVRESGVIAKAIEIDFEKGSALFAIPEGSKWGLGFYRIIRIEDKNPHD